MNELNLSLPAEFISKRVVLSPGELRWGFANGLITSNAAIALATSYLSQGVPLTEAENRLAMLLPEDAEDVPAIVSTLGEEHGEQDHRLVWMYLALAWIYESREQLADPLSTVEHAIVEFGYPAEVRSLLRWMPLEAGQQPGLKALEERWRSYLENASREFLTRKR